MRRSAVFAASLLTLPTGAAWAETSRPFQVAATIVNGCTVATGSSSVGSVALGTVNGATGGSAEGELLGSVGVGVQLDCTPGTTVTMTADAGQQPSGSTRRLAGPVGSQAVPYLLFVNGSTTPWTTQSVSLSFPDGTSRQLIPIHARATVPAGTAAGTYTDTVRVTFSW